MCVATAERSLTLLPFGGAAAKPLPSTRSTCTHRPRSGPAPTQPREPHCLPGVCSDSEQGFAAISRMTLGAQIPAVFFQTGKLPRNLRYKPTEKGR